MHNLVLMYNFLGCNHRAFSPSSHFLHSISLIIVNFCLCFGLNILIYLSCSLDLKLPLSWYSYVVSFSLYFFILCSDTIFGERKPPIKRTVTFLPYPTFPPSYSCFSLLFPCIIGCSESGINNIGEGGGGVKY